MAEGTNYLRRSLEAAEVEVGRATAHDRCAAPAIGAVVCSAEVAGAEDSIIEIHLEGAGAEEARNHSAEVSGEEAEEVPAV